MRPKWMQLIAKFANDESAAVSIEYAAIGGLVSILIIGGASSIGTTVKTMFLGPVATALTGSPSSPPGPSSP